MKLIFLFLTFLLITGNWASRRDADVSCGLSKATDTRIINGEDAKPHEFPWIVSIQIQTGNGQNFHVCGGSVINSRWVLTAEHCLYYPTRSPFRIVAGAISLDNNEDSQQITTSSEFYTIDDTYKGIDTNDIALLLLDDELNLDGETVAPICLPEADQQFDSDTLTYAGWGRDKYVGGRRTTTTLKKITLPVISFDECEDAYKDRRDFAMFLHDCQVCTNSENNTGVCKGDDGSPGMAYEDGRYIIRGISSLGDTCEDPGYPGVDTEVSCYVDWITETIDKNDP